MEIRNFKWQVEFEFLKCKWATSVRQVQEFNAFEGKYTILGLYQKTHPIAYWVFLIIPVLRQKPSQSLLIFYSILRNEIFNFFYFHKTYW
jgi:hypothetical protein